VKKLFEQLLGLADEWRVESCTFDASAGEVNITIVEQERFWIAERERQGENVHLYDHTAELEWRHSECL
jgi:hypothetical protein